MHYYLHIPFCRQKCPYCKFALTPVFDEFKKKRYIGYLKRELGEYFSTRSCHVEIWDILPWMNKQDLSLRSKWQKPRTIYFWWGTPSVLSLDEVRGILDCFRITEDSNTRTFEHSLPEITFECNPEDITSEYATGLFQLWINRISLGIQSLSDTTLKAIHRSDRKSIFYALDEISSALCTMSMHSQLSLNTDFILWLPHTKPGETLEDIRTLHELFPFITHTSVYMLEDGLYPADWKEYSITEKEMEKEYSAICTYFDSLWWHHYEISSWAKPGYECQHNRWYWDHTDTRGFGLSATSYVGGKRWTNSDSFAGYYRWDIIGTEVLTEDEKNLEKLIHDLRTFRLESRIAPSEILEKLRSEGLIEIKEQKIILTPTWIFRENAILSELISS